MCRWIFWFFHINSLQPFKTATLTVIGETTYRTVLQFSRDDSSLAIVLPVFDRLFAGLQRKAGTYGAAEVFRQKLLRNVTNRHNTLLENKLVAIVWQKNPVLLLLIVCRVFYSCDRLHIHRFVWSSAHLSIRTIIRTFFYSCGQIHIHPICMSRLCNQIFVHLYTYLFLIHHFPLNTSLQ